MLAQEWEPEGAELVSESEGQGSGEEPGMQPRRTLRRRGSGMLGKSLAEQERSHVVGSPQLP